MQESKSKFVLNPRTATIYTNVEYKNSKNSLRDAIVENQIQNRVSDCCLAKTQQCFIYIMARTS